MVVKTRKYRSSDADAFRDLNIAWIKTYFEIEATDRKQLDDPDGYFLNKGGQILMAELSGHPVGTVALLPISSTRMELCKMAVDPSVQGQGIGKSLVSTALETAASMGASEVWLETNSALAPAIRLYERAGFKRLSEDDSTDTPYSRCNVQMLKQIG